MKLLGNLLWCLLGGLVSALSWALAGLLWCITIVGIPVGLQCLLNIIWLLVSGLPLAIAHAAWGCILCITIIGIPFGLQFFKIARLALLPFGSRVVTVG